MLNPLFRKKVLKILAMLQPVLARANTLDVIQIALYDIVFVVFGYGCSQKIIHPSCGRLLRGRAVFLILQFLG